MALSFEDSLKVAQEESVASNSATENDASSEHAVSAVSYSLLNEDVSVAAYSLEDDGWKRANGYSFYDDYEDDNVSNIDDEKNVYVNKKQINITQEKNSQFIPFEMQRHYDGFDLLNTTIQIYYVNADGYDGRSTAVNVYYNNDKIRFAWLVNDTATAIAGKLNFEIQAIGTNSKGEGYIWKTKPNGDLNVLKSLQGNGLIIPDNDWITDFLKQVTDQVAVAQNAASTAQSASKNAQAAAIEANNAVATAKTELEGSVETAVNDKVSSALSDYYTKTEVDDIVANIDISDQLAELENQIANIDGLAKFNVEYDGSTMTFYNDTVVIKSIAIPSAEWILTNNAKIEAVQSNLDSYKTTVDADLVGIHTTIDDLPNTLATDYYTKADSDSKFATKESLNTTNTNISGLTSYIEANKDNISTISTKITELESTVSSIDTSPRLTYNAVYNDKEDPDVGENVFVLYEIENEGKEGEIKEAKAKFTIVGGSGGGATSSTLKIEYVTTSPIIATTNDSIVIKYNFFGVDSSGDAITEGNATWKVGGKVVATNIAVAGENSFDITEYITIGTQKVNLTIVDDAGSLVTKNWTVQKIDVRLESSFNDKLTYPIGKVSFDYTPYGAISKIVHFKLDGVEIGTVTTASSGMPMAYEIPSQTHGAHLFETYITAEINGNIIESNHIVKDIIWYDASSDVPVISCVKQEFTAMQYDATNIEYTVYDPNTETPVVTLSVDDDVVSTLTLDSNTQIWQYKSSDVGVHTLTITCGETVKTIIVTIEKLDINIEPVTAGLAFDFNPSGKSNNDADRLWSDGDATMTVSDNFDWINGGYQIDENGDQYFCVKSGTSAVINYNLFADDPKRNGKEFKVVFKTSNIKNRDTSFISCMDNNVGLDMKVENARIYSSNDDLYSPYCEEDIIEFEFNINKDSNIPMVLTYEDGVGNRPMIYTSDSSFMQPSPKPITIGSTDCDVHIYRMKAYSMGLSDRDILSNFIADARSADEMIARYNRNQIYDENGLLTPEILAEKCPDLRVIIVDAPWFTNDKSNKVEDTNITMIYKNGDPILDNWTCTGALHSGRT